MKQVSIGRLQIDKGPVCIAPYDRSKGERFSAPPASTAELRLEDRCPLRIHPITAGTDARAQDRGHRLRPGSPALSHEGQSYVDDACPLPPRMKNRDSLSIGVQEKYRQTVGNGDRQNFIGIDRNQPIPRTVVFTGNGDVARMRLRAGMHPSGVDPEGCEKTLPIWILRMLRIAHIACFTMRNDTGHTA